MKTGRLLGIAPLSCLLYAQTGPSLPVRSGELHVHDGFETEQLSDLWDRSRFVPGEIVTQRRVVRTGRGALAVTVRSGDEFERGKVHNADNERSEILEAKSLVTVQNDPFEYRFSMFFPQDFPVVPVRLVIAQWKQYCSPQAQVCSDDSPVLALRYIGGALLVTQDLDHRYLELFRRKAEFRGRWLDFKVQARFAPNGSGHVKVWLNGRKIVDFHGATANKENAATEYPSRSHFYFKMGLYRNAMREPMTVYIDEYEKKRLLDDQF